MSYDPACEDLARHFLGDLAPKRLRRELAEHIQKEIEGWIEYERERLMKELGFKLDS